MNTIKGDVMLTLGSDSGLLTNRQITKEASDDRDVRMTMTTTIIIIKRLGPNFNHSLLRHPAMPCLARMQRLVTIALTGGAILCTLIFLNRISRTVNVEQSQTLIRSPYQRVTLACWSTKTLCSRRFAGSTEVPQFTLRHPIEEPRVHALPLCGCSSTTWTLTTSCGLLSHSSSRSPQEACSETTGTWPQPCGDSCLATTDNGFALRSCARNSSLGSKSLRHFASSWFKSSWPISPMPRWLRPDILPDWLSMWPSLCYTSRCYWPSGPFSLEWLKDACRGGIYNMNNTGNYTLPCRSSMSTPTSLTTSSLSPLPRRSTMRTRCSKSPPAPLLVCLGHLSHPAPLVCRGHLSHPAPQVYRDRRLWRRWRFRTSVAPARRRRRSKHCRASMLSSGLVQIFRSWHRQAAGYHEFPIHTGRPGPKSGISVWRTPMANDSTEDARVGTSEGRRVPEAPYSAMHSPYMAKPDDHTSTQVKSQGMTLSRVNMHPPIANFCMPVRTLIRVLVLSMPFQSARAMPFSAEPTPYTSFVPPKHTRIVKRSYKRALKRLELTGKAWYKGKLLDSSSLSSSSLHSSANPRSTPSPSRPPARPRLVQQASPSRNAGSVIRFLSWNAGGMSALGLEALLQWREIQPGSLGIICIQETHWSDVSEFQKHDWQCIASGDGTKHSGVLTMIHLPKDSGLQIQCQILIPGRVLHVRINSEPPIDVLNVYQHAWNPNKGCYADQAQDPITLLMQDRAAVLQHVSSWVAAVPQRNQLILAGDFNSYLTAHHPNVGYGLAPHRSSAQRDQKQFQAMVQRLGLLAANTWRRAGPQSATFRNHVDQAVQIDFVFVRIPCNVPRLKTQVLHNAPIVPETGFRHFPIDLEVPCPVISRTHKPTCMSAKVACQRLSHDETAQLFAGQVQQQISALTPAADLDSILLQIGRQVLHHAPQTRKPVPTPQHPDLQLYW